MQMLVRYLKRFAFARGAEEAQAFEIIAPIEVVGAVAVIVQLDGVVLPEPQPGMPILELHQLEAEQVVLPRNMTVNTAPAELALLLEGGDFHDRVEVPGEGPVQQCTHCSLWRVQPGDASSSNGSHRWSHQAGKSPCQRPGRSVH